MGGIKKGDKSFTKEHRAKINPSDRDDTTTCGIINDPLLRLLKERHRKNMKDILDDMGESESEDDKEENESAIATRREENLKKYGSQIQEIKDNHPSDVRLGAFFEEKAEDDRYMKNVFENLIMLMAKLKAVPQDALENRIIEDYTEWKKSSGTR